MISELTTVAKIWRDGTKQAEVAELAFDRLLDPLGQNPIESISFDEDTKELIITMENGVQINIPDEA